MKEPLRVFITGKPGCGKTTLIKHLGDHLRSRKHEVCGFYTEEIRKEGSRVGFIIKTWDGREALLAHKDAKSPHSVGRYKVLLENVDLVAIPSMKPPSKESFILIDEIGKMECLSRNFCRVILSVLEMPNPVIATIPLKGGKFLEQIRSTAHATIMFLNRHNRDDLTSELLDMIDRYLKRKGR